MSPKFIHPSSDFSNVEITSSGIRIANLEVNHPDVIRFFNGIDESEYSSSAIRALEVGVFCLERVQTGAQMDFVRSELETLLNQVERVAGAIPGEVQQALLAKVGTGDGQVLATVPQLIEQVKESLHKSTGEIRQLLADDLDPEKSTSTLGRSLAEVRSLLDPGRNDSVHGRLNDALAQITEESGTLAKSVRSVVADAIKPLADEVNRLSKDMGKNEAVLEAVQQSIGKGTTYEEEVVESLRLWGQVCGVEVSHVGSDNQPGDIVIQIPSTSPLGIEMTIVVETKDHGSPSGRKVIRDEVAKAMGKRGASAGIYVSRRPEGLAKEIGEWSEGECVHGPYIATTNLHLQTAVRLTIMMARLQATRASNPDVDLRSVEAHIERIRTALRCVQTINSKVGTIRREAGGIQEEAESLRDEIRGALVAIEDCFRVAQASMEQQVPIAAD